MRVYLFSSIAIPALADIRHILSLVVDHLLLEVLNITRFVDDRAETSETETRIYVKKWQTEAINIHTSNQ